MTGPGGGGLGGDQGRRGMKWGDGGWRVSRGTHPQTGTYLGTCSLVAAIMHSMLPIVRLSRRCKRFRWMLEAANVTATVDGDG